MGARTDDRIQPPYPAQRRRSSIPLPKKGGVFRTGESTAAMDHEEVRKLERLGVFPKPRINGGSSALEARTDTHPGRQHRWGANFQGTQPAVTNPTSPYNDSSCDP